MRTSILFVVAFSAIALTACREGGRQGSSKAAPAIELGATELRLGDGGVIRFNGELPVDALAGRLALASEGVMLIRQSTPNAVVLQALRAVAHAGVPVIRLSCTDGVREIVVYTSRSPADWRCIETGDCQTSLIVAAGRSGFDLQGLPPTYADGGLSVGRLEDGGLNTQALRSALASSVRRSLVLALDQGAMDSSDMCTTLLAVQPVVADVTLTRF